MNSDFIFLAQEEADGLGREHESAVEGDKEDLESGREWGKVNRSDEAATSFRMIGCGSTLFTGGHRGCCPWAPCRAFTASSFHSRYRTKWEPSAPELYVNLTPHIKSNV